MTYLVMECHPGYAVVLDQTGRFLKVANLNYQVGETVSFVIECTAEEDPITIKSLRRRRMLLSAASLAACFFLAVLGTWHVCLTPYGAVRIQINPDLKLTVNRLDYVISADGLNDDGLRLLDGYQFRGQKLEQASGELADRAMEMGYLKEGGQIFLTLESSHENWIAKTEERLLTELESHLNDTIAVTASEAPASAEPLPTGSLSDVPVLPSAPDDTPLSGISKFQETDEEDDDSEDEGNEDALNEDDEDDSEDTSEGTDDDREDAADRQDDDSENAADWQDDDSERDTDNNDLDEHSPRLDTNDDAEHTDDHNDNDKDEHDSDDSSDKDSNEQDTDDSSDEDGNEHDTDDSSDDDGDEHDTDDSSNDDSNDNDDD